MGGPEWLTGAQNRITVDGHKVAIATPELELDLVGLGIMRIRNKRTGRQYLNDRQPAHLVLSHSLAEGGSHTGFVTERELLEVRKISDTGVRVEYKPLPAGLPGARVTGHIRVSADGAVGFAADVELEAPGLTAILHPIRNLSNRDELLLPVAGGLRLTGSDYPQLFFGASTLEALTAPPARQKQGSFSWPSALSGCFLIYKAGEEGFWLRSEAESLAFKAINFEHTERNIHLAVGSYVSGKTHECRRYSGPLWKIETFQGDWRQKLDQYAAYLRAASPAWKYHKNRIPWVDDVRLVLNAFKVVETDASGRGVDNPALVRDNLELLRRLGGILPPRQVVVYPFVWQLIRMEYGTGADYPNWAPSPLFAKFAADVRKMGYHVMTHLNCIALSPANIHYQEFKPYLIRHPVTGKEIGWFFDAAKGKGTAYVHPAAPGWFELQARLVREMLAAAPIDAIYWDQTLVMPNAENLVVNGKTTIQGTMDFLGRMRAAFPDLAFNGEGITELTIPYQDFVQAGLPGVYALSQPGKGAFHWGLNPETIPVRAPMIGRLYAKCARPVGHGPEPDIASPSFAEWIHLMKEYGLVPTVTGLSLASFEQSKEVLLEALGR
jgi:hypothetical protein